MKVFEISGAVVTERGERLQNVVVAILDRDPLRDDLLGVGCTDGRGAFRLSFTESEFNQDPFERESRPEIYIVFSVHDEGRLRTVDRHDLDDLDVREGPANLGELTLRGFDDTPRFLPDQEPIPCLSKAVKRLVVNDELVAYCLHDVAPRVERLTRWSGLLDGLTVDVADGFQGYLEHTVAHLGLDADALGLQAMNALLSRTVYALYDPLADTIHVNRRTARECNLDGLKVVLGHELVHVGQFRRHPEQRSQYEQHARRLLRLDLRGKTLDDVVSMLRESPFQAHMERFEGYAYYIQTDFLEKHFNCSMIVHHVSLGDKLLAWLARRLGFAGEMAEVAQLKADQYEQGRERYRQHQKGDRPTRFRKG